MSYYTSDTYSCYICGSDSHPYSSSRDLQNHMSSMHPVERQEESITCYNCDRSFTTISARNRHVRDGTCTRESTSYRPPSPGPHPFYGGRGDYSSSAYRSSSPSRTSAYDSYMGSNSYASAPSGDAYGSSAYRSSSPPRTSTYDSYSNPYSSAAATTSYGSSYDRSSSPARYDYNSYSSAPSTNYQSSYDRPSSPARYDYTPYSSAPSTNYQSSYDRPSSPARYDYQRSYSPARDTSYQSSTSYASGGGSGGGDAYAGDRMSDEEYQSYISSLGLGD